MVKKINVVKYRKLQNIEFDFSKGLNVISGTNGTCKTSLIHMISNAYQAVTKNCDWLQDKSCLDVIKQINYITNPKIESLTKGDKAYNDPSNGVHGTIFTVDYFGHSTLEFRKHNSKVANRYAVKPWYKKDTEDRLPYCPTIYLGLSRLLPFGEFQDDNAVEKLKKNLPSQYQSEIAELYRKLTGITVSSLIPQKMGAIKTRADFVSDQPGIDSNTISAGEDNLFIIISALVSLKYYFDNIISNNDIESVLLIDELDATLHPSLQFKLLEVFRLYSQNYKIQLIFTTHSLSILEYALKSKDNVLYLIDNLTSVIKMDSPDIFKIKMYLHDVTRDNIYLSKSIPTFTEDNEARVFLNILFDYFEELYPDFCTIRRFFHLVNANIGADNLKNIFNDSYLLKATMKFVCILDGDQKGDLTKYTITLPGGDSPEKVVMSYALFLFDNDDPFWVDNTILELGYGKIHYRDNIKPDIDNIKDTLRTKQEVGESIHGIERNLSKKVFIRHQRFFELLYKHWVRSDENSDSVKKFYKNLNKMFKKVAEFYGINPRLWNLD